MQRFGCKARMTVARSLGLAALVWSVQAGAIQVGDLETQSGLNEPLRARVLVSEMSEADARTLDVRVADDATYTRLGLIRAPAVEGLEFSLSPTDNGAWSVDIIGQRAVREPFVVLLLDVRSASGRALREFTVLLDPGPVRDAGDILATPLSGSEDTRSDIPAPQISVADAATAANPSTSRSSAEVPAPQSQTATRTVGNQPVVGRQDYKYSTQPSAPVSEAATGSKEFRAGTVYGPVRRGESLSTISKGISQSTGVHVAQVMWALYSANPQAFDGNINKLRVGANLTVPSIADLGAVSIGRSRINIRDAVNEAPVRELAAESEAADAEPEQAEEVPREFQREIVKEEVSEPASPPKVESVPKDVPADVESVESTLPTEMPVTNNEEAEELFDESVETLAEDSATSQADPNTELAEEDGFAEEFVEDDATSSPDEERAIENPDPGIADGVIGLLKTWLLPILAAILIGLLALFALAAARRSKRRREEAEKAEQEAAMRPRPDLVGMARGQPIPDPTDAAPATVAAAGVAAAGVAAAVEPEREDDESATLSFDTAPLSEMDQAESMSVEDQLDAALDELDSDSDAADETPPQSDAAAAVDDEDAAFAALLQAEEPQEGAADTGASSDLGEFDIDFGEPPPAEQDGEGAATASETEPKSMFATASFPLVSDDEGESGSVTDDPVGEAEFQLAYGLYDEAEQTLKGVLEAEPGRLDAMEKLAEVYFAAGRQEDFEKLAMELKRDQGMTQEFRNVEALAQQLIPSSKLFDSADATPSAEETAVDDLSLDLDSDESGSDAANDGSSLDLPSLDIAADEATTEATNDEGPADEGFETVSFEIPDLDEDTAVADAAVGTPETTQGDAAHSVDFDLTEDATQGEEAETPDTSAADATVESEEPDFAATVAFDIPDLDATPDEPPKEVTEEAASEADENLMEFSLDDFGADELSADTESDDLSISLDDGADSLDLDSLSDDLSLDEELAEAEPSESASSEAESSEDALNLEPLAEEDALSLDAFDDGISEGDDLNSKLDLARGYVDMGEIDMARSLLDEVASRGSEDQQAEARKMLESLA